MTTLKKITQLKWRAFLATEVGMEGMLFLREMIPSIHAGDQTAIIFSAGKSEGYKNAIDRISDVIGAEPKSDSDKDLENN